RFIGAGGCPAAHPRGRTKLAGTVGMKDDVSPRPLATQFDTGETLAAGVARTIAETIRDAVAKRGQATIALSGGSTPKAALRKLSQEALPWPQVTITLVDDRWVPPEQPRSNHGMLNETLLHNARAARF